MGDERDVRGAAPYNPRKGEPPLRGLRNCVSQIEFKIKKCTGIEAVFYGFFYLTYYIQQKKRG